jgi:hypothetical protein
MQAVAASAVEAAASAASAASAGKLKQQSADVRPGEYRIPTRLLDKLDADGRAVANSFDWIRGVELANAATAAGQWLAHDARQGAQARALAQSLGCAPVATTRSVPGGRSGTTKPLSP